MAERDIIVNLSVQGADKASVQLEKVASAEKDIANNAAQANQQLGQTTTELKETGAAAQGLTNQSTSLRKQLRNLQQELQKLALAGKTNTQEYKALREEAGRLQDAIADVSEEVRQAGSDTRGLDKAIRVASTATAAFSILQGASALFGKENEELQKSLLKVTAAISVLQGLQEIQAELNRKDSVFTAAAAKAKVAYAAATAGATGALKLFRLALIATGIGAAVVAIGLLIAKWDKLTRAIGLSSEALKNNKKALDDLSAANDKLAKQQDDDLKRREIFGATEDEIKKAAIENNNTLLEQKREELRLLEDQIQLEKENKTTLEFFKGLIPFRDEVIDQKRKEADIDKKYADQLSTLKSAITDIELSNKKLGEEKKKNIKKTTQETKEIQAQIGSIAALNAESTKLQELQSKSNDVSKIAQYQAQIDTLKQEIELLNRQIENFISFQNRVSENPQALQPIISGVERIKTEAELAAEAYERLPLAIKEANAALASNPPPSPFANAPTPEQIKAQIEEERDFRIQGAQLIATGIENIFRQSQQAQLQVLDNRLKQGLISEEQYQKEVAEIRRKEAIAAKLQALFEIGINTAIGITRALGTKFQAILIPLIAALGAAQAAAVAATPIPKFRKGGQVLEGGSLSPEGMLSGRRHSTGGVLIEAEGGEFITRREMAAKYLPLLQAINQDKVASIMKPVGIPLMKTLSQPRVSNNKALEKRMVDLITEVQFLSQYVRHGNKYAKITADTNKEIAAKKTSKIYV